MDNRWLSRTRPSFGIHLWRVGANDAANAHEEPFRVSRDHTDPAASAYPNMLPEATMYFPSILTTPA